MATAYILYNQKAGECDSYESVKSLENTIGDDKKYIDVTGISDYRGFIAALAEDDYIILAGGDGTINCFVNNIDGIEFKNDVLYYPNGTGNDFAHDIGHQKCCVPFSIKAYIKNLPTVSVKGKQSRFINGVGYGIDGYCCEVGDELKKTPGKKVNYSMIAVKGLLFHYKPTNAVVTVDGKTTSYKKVWIAPTMNGRFYGGGMMPTPNQKRNSDTVSLMVFHGSGKLKTLMIFPSLFKGEHVKYTSHIDVIEGKNISVKFDRPVALQIDGETVLDVSSYEAKVASLVEKVDNTKKERMKQA